MHAFVSIDPSEARKSVRKKRTHPYLEESDFSEFSESAISSFSLFLFFFFLEMLTPLEKASSMRNAMEKSVYGKRFKSIYPSSDIRPFNSTFNVINLSINLSNNFNLSSMLLS